MRGDEVTKAQLEHADAFLRKVEIRMHSGQNWVRRDDLVRLLAWYAAIRVKGKLTEVIRTAEEEKL